MPGAGGATRIIWMTSPGPETRPRRARPSRCQWSVVSSTCCMPRGGTQLRGAVAVGLDADELPVGGACAHPEARLATPAGAMVEQGVRVPQRSGARTVSTHMLRSSSSCIVNSTRPDGSGSIRRAGAHAATADRPGPSASRAPRTTVPPSEFSITVTLFSSPSRVVPRLQAALLKLAISFTVHRQHQPITAVAPADDRVPHRPALRGLLPESRYPGCAAPAGRSLRATGPARLNASS
jgi:hypothetical protein